MAESEAAGNFPPPDLGDEVADEPDPAFGETADDDFETPDDDEPDEPDDDADDDEDETDDDDV